MERYDFSGWASRANLKCSDGRTIMKDAFKHCDGQTVPLVWGHNHDDPFRVLGHALLENRDEGMYTYCKFNETEQGLNAKQLVQHGDIVSLSIYANQLKQKDGNVFHGAIREVSLVLAGANPGAFIDSIITHGEESDEEAVIYTGENLELFHAEEGDKKMEEKEVKSEELSHADDEKKSEEKTENSEKSEDDETIEDVLNTLNEKQSTVVNYIIGEIINKNKNPEGGDENMKHNLFDQDKDTKETTLAHDGLEVILKDAKRCGSLKESFLAHAEEYGIQEIETLFPEAKTLNNPPEFIKRDTGWVAKVMNGVHNTPFSRIKSSFADITEDEARAKGYIKGKLKKEEVFSLLKRTTTPTTVYKKQKLDRDDIIDITDFDVVAWLKSEMRMMLDEELARAFLIGDGRLASSDDKINEQNIRPIAFDEDLYTVKAQVKVKAGATGAEKAKAFIDSAIRERKNYKGSGDPICFTTEDVLTECLLLEDGIGHKLYKSAAEVATAIRAKEIVTVEVMEGLKGKNGGDLLAVFVNLKDYNVGADKGGAVNMFDDFDIDYNQQKYLIETRCSGALVKPYSAIAFELSEAN